MMHSVSRPAASSWQGGCPTIAEHQEFMPPAPPQHVIVPNPGYKIEANLWNLDVQVSACYPGPLAPFLRHCNTMDSPCVPSHGRGGTQPADDISNLDRHASMENLRELQKYSEKLQFEATCCRLWADWWAHQAEENPASVDPSIANIRWSTGASDVHGVIFHPAAPSRIMQCSFYHHNQASPDVKESFYGIRTEERTASRAKRRWSMGSGKDEAAPVIGIDDAMAAVRSESKSAIRAAEWYLESSWTATVLLLLSMRPMTHKALEGGVSRDDQIMTWSYV